MLCQKSPAKKYKAHMVVEFLTHMDYDHNIKGLEINSIIFNLFF